MEDGGPTASMSIIFFIVVLLIDVLFYGFNAAMQSLNRKDIESRATEEQSKKATRLLQIMDNPFQYGNTLQLIVTAINFLMGSYYLYFFKNYLNSIILVTIALIYVLLTFGVLIPQKLASKYANAWAYCFVNIIYYITLVLKPLTGLILLTTNGILRLFGVKADQNNQDVTEEEIISMVNEGHEQGVFHASEAQMITNIFEYGDKEAKDIMTHRKNVVAIDGKLPLKDAISFMLQENNSRYPVYSDNIDHIIGILYLKDAMRFHAQDEELNKSVNQIDGLIRNAEFVPETRNIDSLFKSMQSMKIQMVIVVDEYGQTSGLVAMEDILEEIVGNIMDEYDEDEEHIEMKGEDEYLIEGMTPLEELEDKFGIDFEEEEFETLNGFLISKMDRIPNEDEDFAIDVCDYNFKVISVVNKMIQTVLVTKIKAIEKIELKEHDEI